MGETEVRDHTHMDFPAGSRTLVLLTSQIHETPCGGACACAGPALLDPSDGRDGSDFPGPSW